MPNPPETSAHNAPGVSADDPLLPDAASSDITAAPSPHFPEHNLLRSGAPLGTFSRGLLVAGGLMLLAGFGLAGWLSPEARGHGTHQQLGLAPCTFLMLTGKPCPSCGATTAFAHFVRGQWLRAAQANAAALALALVCAALIPWCWASAAKGRLIGIINLERTVLLLVIIMTSLFTLQWVVNLLTY